MKPLKKGLILPGYKYRSLSSMNIHPTKSPRVVNIILGEASSSLEPCVQKGDSVYVGTKIAETSDWFSVPVHSSVSGIVVEASGQKIVIESDEMDRLDPAIQVRREASFEVQ